jgi:hypothetical protein
MDHPQTPRILAPHLSAFQHRIVRVLGKVVQLRGETATIDAGGHVEVLLNRVRLSFPPSRHIIAELTLRCTGRPSRRRPRRRSDWQSRPEFEHQGASRDRFRHEYR